MLMRSPVCACRNAIVALAGAGCMALAAAGDVPDAGLPEGFARQTVEILAAAPADGLDPQAYDADRLRAALAAAAALPASERAALDRAIIAGLRRFLDDLNRGRIAPAEIGEDFAAAAPSVAIDDLVRQAIADGQPRVAVAAARPPLSEYAELRQALARYREIAADPLWQKPLPPLPGRKLEPGEDWAGTGPLAARLALLGDLAPGAAATARYEGALVAAVRAFQSRHGLTPDGIIGKATWEQLAVPAGDRVIQLELALERLRWTPRPDRAVVVNVPEFVLRGFDARDGKRAERVAMNVIVGNAPKTQTPIFSADMRFIEFSPYWNVPPSIARGETIPKLRRDPAYFEQQGFEFVTRDGRVVGAFSEAGLDAVQQGQMRIRQRPGGKNALGDIKFIFPNPDNIYLHHTPTPQLFKRDRRDFSHGCIRVEAPVELAKFVLAGQADWNEERIVESMTKGRSNTLRLPEPLPVVIAYRTAAVIDGKPRFFADLYRRDARLAAALQQRAPVRTSSGQVKNPS
jgi:murein L,D-transpeptidase YcbB/YkuD